MGRGEERRAAAARAPIRDEKSCTAASYARKPYTASETRAREGSDGWPGEDAGRWSCEICGVTRRFYPGRPTPPFPVSSLSLFTLNQLTVFYCVCVCVCVSLSLSLYGPIHLLMTSFTHHPLWIFVGLAYQGKNIVFRFIIEYSSLRDFGP